VTHSLPEMTPDNSAEIAARSQYAGDVAAEFSELFPGDVWRHLARAFADVPALSAEITRLRSALLGARLDRANLAAAARATISAYHDGEPDPLSYLRDELTAQGHDLKRGRP
jgi:hypothetical protein